jgi:S-DNA-T family DNA segregation ATPase FtsK/SpoIIIE
VGATATEPLHLDLRMHGPHALVGGTTGSGKSEFLQSWVLGMATAHSPSRVTFLLVDYKGGSAFADCVRLPHTVGLVTDLSPHLVRRALISLNAELRHREHILNRKGVKDLIELEKQGDPETPPSLVIVVDEFAALVQEVPEFIDGVVNVAQRGRSLGLHLILATQRPAGVIKDNLRANTNLRVALRMADEADSVDVVGDALAGTFDPAIPGRAVAKTGPGRLTVFQAAYVGGRTTGEAPPARVSVGSLDFGSVHNWPEPDDQAFRPPSLVGIKTDIQRMVDTVAEASALAQLPSPRKPWLPELARVYDLAALPTRRLDTELVFGVLDDPEAQEQPVVAYHPDQDGSMAVYGTGGSGKTVLLRAIAIAAGLTVRGGPCVVYGLDFAGRGLSPLEALPHVGSVVSGEDEERVVRLIRWLRDVVDDRAARFAAVNAGTITQYRELASRPDENRIIVLVDGLGAFRQAYETGQRARWFDTLSAIAAEGRQVGVHVVVSADRPGAVPSSLASALQRRVVLRLANENDEAMLGVPRDVLSPKTPPGRGLLDGSDVQVGILGKDPSTPGQAAAIARLAEVMRRNGVRDAEPILRLPERVDLTALPVRVDGRPTVGLLDDTLGPVGLPDTGVFVVAGPPRSGRTTALTTLVTALRRQDPGVRLVYLGTRRSPLRTGVRWDAAADSVTDVAEVATELASQLTQQAGSGTGTPALAVVIEGVPDFLNTAADQPLQELVAACRASERLVLCDGETTALTGSWPLLQAVKVTRSGIALQPDQVDGDTVFRTPFPRVNRGDFPPGRGLLVHAGRAVKIQVAMPGEPGSEADTPNKMKE